MITRGRFLILGVACAVLAHLAATAAPDSFRFVILGDRTGEAQPGVYEQVWRETAAQNPAFVVTVGDIIQGAYDASAEQEWQQVKQMLAPYHRFPLYLTPGNHDIWSPHSDRMFRKYAGHPPHYSFDYGVAHFTILDNSQSDEMPADEMAFLEQDLEAHKAQPVKFILSHRPSWLINVAFGNSQFPLHQLAKKYGVHYVIAGHVHQMLHVELDGVQYVSMPSAGGHLRASGKYEDGWFFAYTLAEVRGRDTILHVHEVKPPHGQGRITTLKDWGRVGLVKDLLQ